MMRPMPNPDPALRLHDVHVRFGTQPGLARVSLEVAAGERVVLLGPSGEGKTTLLRAIAGLSPMHAGTVTVSGRDVSTETPDRRGTVYLHQTPVLFPHLSVRENVAFPLTVRGVARPERDRAVGPLLDRLGLSALGDRAPSALSGGQQHRVALARALAARPPVLLLDEPLSALDPVLRDDVRRAIRDAHEGSGAALLLVTHDLDDAAALGDRVGVLLHGTLRQLAPPGALFAMPSSLSVMRFVGAHQELPGVMVAHGVARTALGDVPVHDRTLSAGAAVVVGVRAQALQVMPADVAGAAASPGERPDATSTARGLRARVVAVQERAQGPVVVLQAEALTLTVPLRSSSAPPADAHMHVYMSDPLAPCPAFAS
jgi:ABC-type Fe3+/spermidine/putrescine transport system ATPase subunit